MKTLTSLSALLAIVPVCLLSSSTACGQLHNDGISPASNVSAELDVYFKSVVDAQKYVGLGACLIKGDEIVWEGAYGYSDFEAQKRVKSDDIFQLASLSKVVTATALMQLYDKGKFQLDDDVNGYIPIKVRNPHFPEKPITFRMLLTHRAGFADTGPASNKFSLGVHGDSPIPLQGFVEDVFTPGGKYYAAECFSTSEPGTKYEYSNMAFWLIGYLVEKIAQQDFSEFCKKNIFKPLAMNNTGWHLRDLDTSRIVFAYMSPEIYRMSHRGASSVPDSSAYVKVQHFGVPGYPEGMLRTTMQDFAKFVAAMMNRGSYGDYQMLKPETAELMLSLQHVPTVPSRGFKVVDMALAWQIHDVGGEQLYTMNGFSGSIFTTVFFSPKDKTAFMFYYTGITMKNMAAMMEITQKLRNTLKAMTQS